MDTKKATKMDTKKDTKKLTMKVMKKDMEMLIEKASQAAPTQTIKLEVPAVKIIS